MESIRKDEVVRGGVRRAGKWAVVEHDGEVSAVSRRCRHQLADLSEGTLAKDGCLVCPWHGARYDVISGEMTRGPRGFLGYRGPTPGYTSLILMLGKVWKLRRARVRRVEGRIELR